MLKELKTGLFILISLAVLAWATLSLHSMSFFGKSGYRMVVTFQSAQGIRTKTPVELAGIEVGYVEAIELVGSKYAKVTLHINKGVALPKDTIAVPKAKGFLGESYIELQPGKSLETLPPETAITAAPPAADFSGLTQQMSAIAIDLKAITSALRQNIEGEGSRLNQTLAHIELLTHNLAEITQANSANISRIVDNLVALSGDLRAIAGANQGNINETLNRIANVSKTIDEGRGTLGRLVNDESTVEKLNESLDTLNSTLGSVSKLKTEIGYHTELLGTTGTFKHYVDLSLQPRPDKSFRVELVSNPNPPPDRVTEIRTVTSGGTSSTVTTETQTANKDRFLFSAQLAKQYYDFTIRGGIIESRGGVGVDYTKGRAGLSFSAFDFRNSVTNSPHLKAWGHFDINKNVFLTSGVDDFISKQDNRNWFVGAGIKFIDEDIKGLLGSFKLGK